MDTAGVKNMFWLLFWAMTILAQNQVQCASIGFLNETASGNDTIYHDYWSMIMNNMTAVECENCLVCEQAVLNTQNITLNKVYGIDANSTTDILSKFVNGTWIRQVHSFLNSTFTNINRYAPKSLRADQAHSDKVKETHSEKVNETHSEKVNETRSEKVNETHSEKVNETHPKENTMKSGTNASTPGNPENSTQERLKSSMLKRFGNNDLIECTDCTIYAFSATNNGDIAIRMNAIINFTGGNYTSAESEELVKSLTDLFKMMRNKNASNKAEMMRYGNNKRRRRRTATLAIRSNKTSGPKKDVIKCTACTVFLTDATNNGNLALFPEINIANGPPELLKLLGEKMANFFLKQVLSKHFSDPVQSNATLVQSFRNYNVRCTNCTIIRKTSVNNGSIDISASLLGDVDMKMLFHTFPKLLVDMKEVYSRLKSFINEHILLRRVEVLNGVGISDNVMLGENITEKGDTKECTNCTIIRSIAIRNS